MKIEQVQSICEVGNPELRRVETPESSTPPISHFGWDGRPLRDLLPKGPVIEGFCCCEVLVNPGSSPSSQHFSNSFLRNTTSSSSFSQFSCFSSSWHLTASSIVFASSNWVFKLIMLFYDSSMLYLIFYFSDRFFFSNFI